jgi:hypothetical protein
MGKNYSQGTELFVSRAISRARDKDRSAIEGISLTSTLFFVKPVTARVAALSIEAKEAINVAPAIAARHDDDDD